MIDDFTIFSRSGLILWRKSFVKLRGDPLARLVQSVLLEDRAALPELVCDGYTVRWLLANDVGLVYALVYQTALPPAYAADLLSLVRSDFGAGYAEVLKDPTGVDFSDFTPHFDRLLRMAEDQSLNRAAAARNARSAASSATTVASYQHPPTASSTGPRLVAQKSPDRGKEASGASSAVNKSNKQADLNSEEVMRRNREAFLKKRMGSGGGLRSRKTAAADSLPGGGAAGDSPASGQNGKRGKAPRKSEQATEEDMDALDFSADKPATSAAGSRAAEGGVSDAEVARFVEQFVKAKPNTAYTILEDADAIDNEGDIGAANQSESNAARGGVFGFFKSLAGLKNLERRDLEPALEQFRDALIEKNVAQDIADRLMESVATSLEGKRLESMTTVNSTVRKALEDALTRILTPRQSVDILADIAAKRASGRPYVIAFCGVNGVGKSTSLAKTCFYLINNGYKVMIAACDTFRAGAVEQLRTHVRCLGDNVDLFDRGYGKDAAAVAMDAVRRAKELRYDVVLIDTAGRMQDNEPLMRALSKLVEVNQPDRLLFVGEALVGNDAVDQLKKFNAALADHQKSAYPRLIDGIVLTKFDTIDDKVGAAVSMVYTTGQPIVFVGVGQTYMDLRKVNTASLVKALLK